MTWPTNPRLIGFERKGELLPPVRVYAETKRRREVTALFAVDQYRRYKVRSPIMAIMEADGQILRLRASFNPN